MAAATFPNWLAGQRITASMLNSMIPLIVVKPADESVASSVVLQPDNDLLCPVVANATYDFDCYLNYEALVFSSNGGITIEWTGPSGATLRFGIAYLIEPAGTDSVSATRLDSTSYSLGGRGAGSLCAAVMTGTLITSATAGNLALQWAQATSSATATIVHAQSKLSMKRTA